jgi:hypothetical protein
MEQTGKHLRDEGFAKAIGNAPPSWAERYRAMMKAWFVSRPEGFRFTGETLRIVATEQGLPAPHHPNAWGAAASGFISGLLRDKQIYLTSEYTQAKSPKAHGRAYRQYEKIVARRYRFADDENQLQMAGL